MGLPLTQIPVYDIISPDEQSDSFFLNAIEMVDMTPK